MAAELLKRGANLNFHDPRVSVWDITPTLSLNCVEDLYEAVDKADVVVLLQKHREYDVDLIESRANTLLDSQGNATLKENRL